MDANSTNTPEPEKNKRSFFDRFKRDKAEPSIPAPVSPDLTSSAADEPVAPKSSGLLGKMQRALSRTSRGLGDLFLGAKVIDDDLFEELETLLLMADVGVEATSQIIAQLTEHSNRAMLKDGAALQAALREILIARLVPCEQALNTDNAEGPFVMLVVGVNGVGKTSRVSQ
jgi:fused signal recognition particle receptor